LADLKNYREPYRLVILSPGLFSTGAKNLMPACIKGKGFFLFKDGIGAKKNDFGNHPVTIMGSGGLKVPSIHGII
jgi:hypothetical protein